MLTLLGKSALASFVIESLQSVPSSSVLYFFCKSGDKDRDTFLALARSLIQQAVVLGNAEHILSYCWDLSAKGRENTLVDTKEAEKLLNICIESLSSLYIVIDGLDECKQGDKRRIVSWFCNLADRLKDDGHEFRCLFLSRNDEDTSKLHGKDPMIIEMEAGGVALDIQKFCMIEGKQLKSRSLSSSETDQIARKVAKHAKCKLLSTLTYHFYLLKV
jgi:hypothetical protein